jgi:hypothetical protein
MDAQWHAQYGYVLDRTLAVGISADPEKEGSSAHRIDRSAATGDERHEAVRPPHFQNLHDRRIW